MLLTSGNIEHIRLVGDSIEIAGWCVCHQPTLVRGSLSRFIVAVDGEPVEILASQDRVVSPDIARAFPEISESATARFAMKVSARRARSGALVQVRPVDYSGQAGVAISSVLDPHFEMPPIEGVDIIGGDFHRNAMEFLGVFVDMFKLRKDSKVLDAGCGYGRMAYALSHYLAESGSYLGFDVMADAIQYCKRVFSARESRYKFVHLDAKNGMYNPGGSVDDRHVVFPGADVDFVIMTSVVTHLLFDAARRYVEEASRVLVTGGKALLTAFSVDEEAARLISDGRSSVALQRSDEHRCWFSSQSLKERVVGFDAADIYRWCDEAGFEVSACIPGRWSKRTPAVSYQDIFMLTKR